MKIKHEDILKTYRERINEMPVKMHGDAPFETLSNRNKSKDSLSEFYLLKKNGDLEIYKSKKFDYIIAGKWYFDNVINEDRLALVAELSFIKKHIKSTNKIINKPIIEISTIQVHEANRREGIAKYLYNLLVQDFIILSDKIQYEHAVDLWKSFIKVPKIKVYIYDSLNDKIISKMTKKTPDEHIWSNGDKLDFSKHKIQLLLTI